MTFVTVRKDAQTVDGMNVGHQTCLQCVGGASAYTPARAAVVSVLQGKFNRRRDKDHRLRSRIEDQELNTSNLLPLLRPPLAVRFRICARASRPYKGEGVQRAMARTDRWSFLLVPIRSAIRSAPSAKASRTAESGGRGVKCQGAPLPTCLANLSL